MLAAFVLLFVTVLTFMQAIYLIIMKNSRGSNILNIFNHGKEKTGIKAEEVESKKEEKE